MLQYEATERELTGVCEHGFLGVDLRQRLHDSLGNNGMNKLNQPIGNSPDGPEMKESK